MTPEAKQIYFFFILPPPEIGTALCCWISRMRPRLQLAGELLTGLKSIPCPSLSHSVHGRGREPSKQHGRGKRRPLSHTAVICDKLHPVPCSTSLQQGRRLNSKTLSQFNPYLTNTQQAAGGGKKSKVQPNDSVSNISDQLPKILPWGFF